MRRKWYFISVFEARESYDARVITTRYRVHGNIYLPPKLTLAQLLNTDAAGLLPITSPLIYSIGFKEVPETSELRMSAGFMGIYYDQILWVEGGRAVQSIEKSKCPQTQLAVLYDQHLLLGSFSVGDSLRSSDFVRSAKSFQTLYNVSLYLWQEKLDRILIMGEGGNALFEVGAYNGDPSPVVLLEPHEKFDFLTVNLKHSSGVLEAPETNIDLTRFTIVK